MTTAADLRLSGARVLLHGRGLVEADLLIAGGRIAGILAPGAAADAAEELHLNGLAILPGGVDPHLHLGHGSDISRPRVPSDAETETAAAAVGGVTTFIPYVLDTGDTAQVFEEVRRVTEAGARIDFGLHFVVATEAQLAAVPRTVRALGVPTVKLFMNSRGEEGKRLGLGHLDDGFLFRLLETLRDAGGMLCPHPESIEVAWVLRDRLVPQDPEGKGGLAAWNATRPPFIEAEAVRRVGYFARVTGTPVYAVHISSGEALEAARAARAEGTRMHVETCIHYLTLDTTAPIGDRGKVNPPLRDPADREALWRGIAAGAIDTVGTDHIHRPLAAKSGGIWKASPGFPGLETLLPALLTEGRRRGIGIERLSDLLSRNPARIMGLAPAKGEIAPGADADLAVIDPGARWVVPEQSVSDAGYNVLAGATMEARVVHTLVRGRFALRDGALQPEAIGTGRYVARQLPAA